MPASDIPVSRDFRRHAGRASFFIFLFCLLYLLLLAAAAVLCGLCLYAAYRIFVVHVSIGAGIIGLAIAAFGLLIFYFLTKFLIKQREDDATVRQRVRERDQPELFALLRELAAASGTKMPKHVYLTPEVNASVFYDSVFLSLFSPRPKNLTIGMGLLTCTTVQELRAVLAHEFGHFSQRSMTIGSYAYHCNRVIHDLLFENHDYESVVATAAHSFGFMSLVAVAANLVVRAIQYLLAFVYRWLNRAYLALSREMEFHADAVAAHVAGFAGLEQALLRLNLAQEAQNLVIQHYNGRIDDRITSENIFPEQDRTLDRLARRNGYAYRNGFPIVPLAATTADQPVSKLNLENPWSSHPELPDRVEKLRATGQVSERTDDRPALSLLREPRALQRRLTEALFAGVPYDDPPRQATLQEFTREMDAYLEECELPSVYDGAFDSYHPLLSLEQIDTATPELSTKPLYDAPRVHFLKTLAVDSADARTVRDIAAGQVEVSRFSYAGRDYRAADARALARDLERDRDRRLAVCEAWDLGDFRHYLAVATTRGEEERYRELYREFIRFNDALPDQQLVTTRLRDALAALNAPLDTDRAERLVRELGPLEAALIERIRFYLEHPLFAGQMQPGSRRALESFCRETRAYLRYNEFDLPALQQLFTMLDWTDRAREKLFFLLKRRVLVYQAELLSPSLAQREQGWGG